MNVASPDRRIATGVVAVVGLVLAIVIAGAPKPHRSQDAILRDVVQLLVRGEQQDARVEYTNMRRDAKNRRAASSITTWFRVEPPTRLLLAGDLLQIETDTISAQCVGSNRIDDILGNSEEENSNGRAVGAARCLPRERASKRGSAEGFFLAVRVRRAYSVIDLATHRISGESARCFRFVRLKNHDPIGQLGDRTDMCLSPRGVLLRSAVEAEGRLDERTATDITYSVDERELDRVVEQYAVE